MPALSDPRPRWGPLLALPARIFPGLGLGLLFLAALFACKSWWGTLTEIRVSATVTENTAKQTTDGTVIYTSHLRFRLPSGEMATIADPVTSNDPDDPDLSTSDVVPILYPAGHPEQGRVATIGRLYKVAILLGILGVVAFDVGLILRLRLNRGARSLVVSR